VNAAGAYVWRNDLIERHSLTLCGPEGWLAHVLRNEDGTWYGYAADTGERWQRADADARPELLVLVDNHDDVLSAMQAIYALAAQCNWPAEPGEPRCDEDRAAKSAFCSPHAATAAALAGRRAQPGPEVAR
jgi:hypothetical protein